MGKKSTPKAPDYSEQIAQQTELSREAMDFYRQIYYEDLRPQEQLYDQLLQEQVARQNQISDIGLQQSIEDRNRYLQTFAPIEASMVAEAMGLPQDPAVAAAQQRLREEAARRAAADVGVAYAGSEGEIARGLARMGVNPSSGAMNANYSSLAMDKARATSAAMNQASLAADTQSWAKRADMVNVGRGLSAANLSAAGLGAGTSMNAANLGGLASANTRANAGVMGTGFGQASQFGMNAANIQNMGFQNQLAASQAQSSPLGAILGTGLGMFAGSYGAGLGARFAG